MTTLSQPLTAATLLLTRAPDHPNTLQALILAQNFCKQWQQCYDTAVDLRVFLYADAVHLANRLVWRPADSANPVLQWQQLAATYQLTIQVCVSAALARGITDSDNAKRHGLSGENMANGFVLVGLGELAMHLHATHHVWQF